MLDSVSEPRCVWYPSLRDLGAELRRIVSRVVPPVHTFNIPARLMRGLCSVALLTEDEVLHRCVVSYSSEASIAADLRKLDNLLRWAELDRTEGRIELGANTGQLLRYFLPNVDELPEGCARERRRRSRAEWIAAARRLGPPWRLWQIQGPDGSAVGSISSLGVHCLLRLGEDGARHLRATAEVLDVQGWEPLGADTDLFRDVMGEWRET